MRWLTKLFHPPAPLRPRPPMLPTPPTWRRAWFEVLGWDAGRRLVRFPARQETAVLPLDLVEFAEQCGSSLSWEEHRENFARRAGLPFSELGPDLAGPEACARLGLVEPSTLPPGPTSSPHPPAPALAWAGIISQGTPGLALRCTQSLADHLRLHGRALRPVVVAPAAEPEASGLPMPVLGPRDATALAAWLAATAGADPSRVRQALAHPDTALLALAAGQPFLRVDETVEFELQDLHPRPGHLVAGTSWHPYQYRAGLDLSRTVQADFPGALECLLGRPVDAVLAAHPALEFSGLDRESRRRLHQPGATVRMAMAGAWGDVVGGLGGENPPLHPALAPGFGFHAQAHEAWMTSRFLHQCALAAALTGPGPVGAGAAALDARVLLPPPPPGVSLQSACYTWCVWHFRPESWIGHAPRALARVPLQVPPGAAAFAHPPGGASWTCPPPALWQSLLQQTAPPLSLADPACRLEWSGAALAASAAHPARFRDFLHAALCAVLESSLAEAHASRDAFRLPAALVAMDEHLLRLEQAAADPLAALPPIPGGEDPTAPWRTQAAGYAVLCQAWPGLWTAAAAEPVEAKVARFTGAPRP